MERRTFLRGAVVAGVAGPLASTRLLARQECPAGYRYEEFTITAANIVGQFGYFLEQQGREGLGGVAFRMADQLMDSALAIATDDGEGAEAAISEYERLRDERIGVFTAVANEYDFPDLIDFLQNLPGVLRGAIERWRAGEFPVFPIDRRDLERVGVCLEQLTQCLVELRFARRVLACIPALAVKKPKFFLVCVRQLGAVDVTKNCVEEFIDCVQREFA